MTDQELLKVTKEFRKGILGKRKPDSMCAAVCWPLSSYLKLFGVKTRVVQGMVNLDGKWRAIRNHFWLELEDGRILDPTGSQFNQIKGIKMPTVYLGKLPTWLSPDQQPNMGS